LSVFDTEANGAPKLRYSSLKYNAPLHRHELNIASIALGCAQDTWHVEMVVIPERIPIHAQKNPNTHGARIFIRRD
jgi:hypothetical protein